MRDPARIPTILNKIKDFWEKYPDWRLGQLIVNAVKMESPDLIVPQVFYIEDDKLYRLLEVLEDRINENLGKPFKF